MKFNNSALEYVAALQKRGYVTLGQGHFSTVLAKPGSTSVIKVSGTGYGKTSDDGWPAYVSFLRQNLSPHAPAIHRFKRHNEGTDRSFYVAVIERLEWTVDEVRWQRKKGHPATTHGWNYASKVLWGHSVTHPEEFAELRSFMEKIREAFVGIYDFDLHGANVMVRSDGILVIIDPLSFPTN